MKRTITYLEATTPSVRATKTFEKIDGKIVKRSYPNMYKVNSHSFEISSIDEFHALSLDASEKGWALLKGNPNRQLIDESRAGSTKTHTPTGWMNFDIDGLKGFYTPEEFIERCLPSEFHDVSYTWHPSASSGIVTDRGLSCHINFLLDEDVPAPLLKNWLVYQNITNQALADHLKLSKNGVMLVYALDASTCQNDKLLYIASPECIGFEDPIKERHKLVKKAKDTVHIDPTATPPLQGLVEAKVDELRRAIGLKTRKARYKNTILINPEPATFIEVKRERGFVYGGIEGYESTSYWYKEDNPEILYNFKGAPPMYLRDIDPGYYRQITAGNTAVLGFRDIVTDQYWNGTYNDKRDAVDIDPTSSKDKLADHFRNHGLTPPDPVPDWERYFDPTEHGPMVDFDRKRVNTYDMSDIMRDARELPEPVTTCPPQAWEVIVYACGGCEKTAIRFIHWIAYIVQKRRKPKTAWVIHGEQGTGKGLMYSMLFQPVLGDKYCIMQNLANIKDQFNGWLEQALLVAWDEANVEDMTNSRAIMQIIKTYITEETQQIRCMRANAFTAKNYTGHLFFSNLLNSVSLEDKDRRFQIAPRQETPIEYTDAMGERLQEEQVAFASYLMNLKINIDWVQKAEESEAKTEMKEVTSTTIDDFFGALQKGNLDYFLAHYNDEAQGSPSAHMHFQTAINRWCRQLHKDKQLVTLSDLISVYNFMQDKGTTSASKMKKMLRRHKLMTSVYPSEIGPVTGLMINWTVENQIFASIISKNSQVPS